MSAKKAGRHKCRNAFCSNYYDDVIGGNTAFGKHKAGAVCIPCLYSEQLLHQGLTPGRVEEVQHLMDMFTRLLADTGWTWQHVKDSYDRRCAAAVTR